MGGGVTLIFSYIRRLGSFCGVQNLNSIFLRVFSKINIFGVRRFCGYFLGSSQN